MIRRALLAGAALAAAMAPAAAEARPSIVVQAAATGVINYVEVMNVQFECAAANAGTSPVRLQRCSFGPIYANTDVCYDCYNPPVASGSGNLAVGLPYDLCVEASAYSGSTWQTVRRCAPYSYLTNTAVIAG